MADKNHKNAFCRRQQMGLFGKNAKLEKINRDIAAIADGNTNLSHTIGMSGNDTQGKVSSNLNRFFKRVREVIEHVASAVSTSLLTLPA